MPPKKDKTASAVLVSLLLIGICSTLLSGGTLFSPLQFPLTSDDFAVSRDRLSHGSPSNQSRKEADLRTSSNDNPSQPTIEINDRMIPLPGASALELEKTPQALPQNSSTATVMGMATGLGHDLFRFVGTLRKAGFQGHIILGVSSDIQKSVLDYLIDYGVTPKFMTFANCTYEPFFTSEEEEKREWGRLALSTCMEPYLDVKARWAKFPLGRDWLLECPTCTGPVMITDVRDVFFQRDPFGPGTPEVVGLQVYEEHPNVTTENWLVDWPVGDCKGVHLKEPMLCSGTTIGTRDAMITYLETMYAEMKRWIVDPKCRFRSEGDDQSIHNWLFYNRDLKDAVAVKHREGVVNTIGYEGAVIYRAKEERLKRENITKDANSYPYPGATSRTWISTDFGLTNEDGEITNFDGSVSPAVHQYDRLGFVLQKWVDQKLNRKESS